jgi:hypothetical protein
MSGPAKQASRGGAGVFAVVHGEGAVDDDRGAAFGDDDVAGAVGQEVVEKVALNPGTTTMSIGADAAYGDAAAGSRGLIRSATIATWALPIARAFSFPSGIAHTLGSPANVLQATGETGG